MKTDAQRFPPDGRGILCGHNFPPRQCPYAKCGYRETLERLEQCEAEWQQPDDALLRIGAPSVPFFEQIEWMRKRLEQCDQTLARFLSGNPELGDLSFREQLRSKLITGTLQENETLRKRLADLEEAAREVIAAWRVRSALGPALEHLAEVLEGK